LEDGKNDTVLQLSLQSQCLSSSKLCAKNMSEKESISCNMTPDKAA